MVKTLSFVVLLGLTALGAPRASTSIAYGKASFGGMTAHTVTVDLADPRIRVSVALAPHGAGSSETFHAMIDRTRPAAAITGTLYDTRTYIPTGDIALFGTVVHSGCVGSALCIDGNNHASIVPLKSGRKTGWDGYETVLCAGPTLVSGGKVAIALRHEGFRTSLLAPTSRAAVGITKAGKLLMVVVRQNVSLYAVAKLMIKLNVVDAVCLDGGSSTALYHNGRYLAVPMRRMTNCLVAYSSEDAYSTAKAALVPPGLLAKSEQRAGAGPTKSVASAVLPPDSLTPPTPVLHR